jgi:hypothetical protein
MVDFIKDLEGALKELSKAVAATTGKPESYVVVHVIPDQVRSSQICFLSMYSYSQCCRSKTIYSESGSGSDPSDSFRSTPSLDPKHIFQNSVSLTFLLNVSLFIMKIVLIRFFHSTLFFLRINDLFSEYFKGCSPACMTRSGIRIKN